MFNLCLAAPAGVPMATPRALQMASGRTSQLRAVLILALEACNGCTRTPAFLVSQQQQCLQHPAAMMTDADIHEEMPAAETAVHHAACKSSLAQATQPPQMIKHLCLCIVGRPAAVRPGSRPCQRHCIPCAVQMPALMNVNVLLHCYV